MKRFLFVTVLQQCAKVCALALLLSGYYAVAQPVSDYGFVRQNVVPVHSILGNNYLYPWAGGLNSCQFSAIDLNLDGIDDLFVFDRVGNRVVTFVNQGTPNLPDYVFDPSYAAKFPAISDWVRLADYNCDGKMDIFCYGYGGITVYENVSTAAGGLSFEWKVNQLLSYIFGSYSNIFVYPVDYPIVKDMDGDGDLDILNFFIGGSFLNFHKNLSMEKYGSCDSLDYKMTVFCWGKMKENDTSNGVILDVPCPFKNCNAPAPVVMEDEKSIEHIGSTLLALDLNNDSVQDILVGDNAFSTIIALINDGTKDSAHIASQIPVFPANTIPVKLNSFPAADYVDIDNDGRKDLLVSPFDPSYTISENRKSVWLYKNSGTTAAPIFNFQQNDFLQEEMIDVGSDAMPVLYDVDNDGLTDLLIGNYGVYDSTWSQNGFLYSRYIAKLTLLKNTGTQANPAFAVVDTNFASVAQLKLVYAAPALADLDGDGDADMLLGGKDGKLIFFKNNAGPGVIPVYDPPLMNYQGLDVGDFSAPQLFDLNNDNKPDLIIGTQKGRIQYFRNTGTLSAPAFVLITDTLGGIDVNDPDLSNYGYAKPCFFRTTAGETRAFVGTLNHGVNYYKNIDANLSGTFVLESQNYLSMQDGAGTAVAYGFLNNDTLPDLILGNASGGLAYHQGLPPLPIGIDDQDPGNNFVFELFPNPAKQNFSIRWANPAFHGKLSVSITDLAGRVLLRRLDFDPQTDKIDLAGWRAGIYLVHGNTMEGDRAGAGFRCRKLILIP